MESIIKNILSAPYFQAWAGAICAHMLTLFGKDYKGTLPFLRDVFPKHKNSFYARLNLILLPIIGASISVIVMEPSGLKDCFMTGLTWNATLNLIVKNKSSEQ